VSCLTGLERDAILSVFRELFNWFRVEDLQKVEGPLQQEELDFLAVLLNL